MDMDMEVEVEVEVEWKREEVFVSCQGCCSRMRKLQSPGRCDSRGL